MGTYVGRLLQKDGFLWVVPTISSEQRSSQFIETKQYRAAASNVEESTFLAFNRLLVSHSPRRPVSVHGIAISSRLGAGCLGRAMAPPHTYPAEQMIAWSVSAAVGSVRNNDPRLIRRIHSRGLIGNKP